MSGKDVGKIPFWVSCEWMRFGDQFQSQSLLCLLQHGPKFPGQAHNTPDLSLVMCHMMGPKIQLATISGLPESEDVGDTGSFIFCTMGFQRKTNSSSMCVQGEILVLKADLIWAKSCRCGLLHAAALPTTRVVIEKLWPSSGMTGYRWHRMGEF